MVDKWVDFAQILLWPPRCIVCGGQGEDGRDLCAACWRELPFSSSVCQRCAEPLVGAGLCGRCLRSPPRFDHTFALFEYRDPVDLLIRRFKFDGQIHLARLLGEAMAEALPPGGERVDVVVPVPLHPWRLRQRGFNQALELGRFVAAGVGLPLWPEVCQRRLATSPQTSKTARQRRMNLRGAFKVITDVRGLRIALVDDVMTTGSTADALAKVLKQAGAARVEVWVCARAGVLR